MTRALVLAVAALVATAAIARADDDAVLRQKMRFTERGDRILVTGTINKLFDAEAYEALRSGFESTVLIRLWVFPRGGSEAVGFQVLTRKVVYDIWDEVYQVQLEGPRGREKLTVKHQAEALKLLTAIEAEPIAEASALPVGDHHVLIVVAELNPVSEETLAEVRRWLTKGSGGGLERGGGVFGSVVSVFVNPKVAKADRVLRLRSQPFYRPEE